MRLLNGRQGSPVATVWGIRPGHSAVPLPSCATGDREEARGGSGTASRPSPARNGPRQQYLQRGVCTRAQVTPSQSERGDHAIQGVARGVHHRAKQCRMRSRSWIEGQPTDDEPGLQ